jgi:Spy/CpxP family protein refolding chaperone
MKPILAVLFILLCRLPALSQAPEQRPDPHAPVLAVAQFLGFSQTQTSQFLQAFDGFQSAMQNVQTQIAAKQRQLEELIRSAPPVDPGRIGQVVLEIHALQSQAQQVIGTYHNTFLSLLSPEQLQKVQMVNQARQLIPAVGVFAAVALIAPPAM